MTVKQSTRVGGSMKTTQIMLILILNLAFRNASGFVTEVTKTIQTLNAEDSLTVFDKMNNMKKIRETTGSGRELEHRLFISSDKALTLHCVAFVSPLGNSFLAETCKVIIKFNLSQPDMTSISRIAEGQGILVVFKNSKDNSILSHQFLAAEPLFSSTETIEVKVDNEVKTAPIFAVRCKSDSSLTCRMNLYRLDN